MKTKDTPCLDRACDTCARLLPPQQLRGSIALYASDRSWILSDVCDRDVRSIVELLKLKRPKINFREHRHSALPEAVESKLTN